jgi:hypothetical protein
VLDDVGHVGLISLYPGAGEGVVEKAAGRTYERTSFAVLSVARLLSDEHHFSLPQALPEHRLRAAAPQLARLASGCSVPQLRECEAVGKQFGGGIGRAHALFLPPPPALRSTIEGKG